MLHEDANLSIHPVTDLETQTRKQSNNPYIYNTLPLHLEACNRSVNQTTSKPNIQQPISKQHVYQHGHDWARTHSNQQETKLNKIEVQPFPLHQQVGFCIALTEQPLFREQGELLMQLVCIMCQQPNMIDIHTDPHLNLRQKNRSSKHFLGSFYLNVAFQQDASLTSKFVIRVLNTIRIGGLMQ